MNYSKKKVLVFIVLSCSIFVSSLLSSQMVYSAPGVFNLQIKELVDVRGKYSYYVTVPPFPDRNSDYRCTIDRQLPRGVIIKVYERSDRECKYPLYLEHRGGKLSFTAKGYKQLRIRFELERYSSPVKGFSLDLLYEKVKTRNIDRVDSGKDYPEGKKIRSMPASSSSSVSARRDERGDSRDRDVSSDSVKDLEVKIKQEIFKLKERTMFANARTSQEQCRKIGNSRNLSAFLGNLQSFNNQRYELSAYVVNVCLKALKKINGSIELIDALLQVAKSKGAVDAITTNTAIQAFVAGGNYDKAKELYNSHSSLRDERTINIMLKAAGENNDVDFMLQLFDDNPKLRNAVTLNTLIQQLANNKCYPKAKELYNSHSSLRNERTVAIMLKAAGENNDVVFMLQLFDDNPTLRDTVTLNTLIQQLANNERYPKAKELYNSHSNLRNERTVAIMLKAAGENNDVDFMLQLFYDNPTLRDTVALSTLIQQLANNGSYPKAKELYYKHSSLRNERTVAIMLKAVGENNDVGFAERLFDEFRSKTRGDKERTTVYNIYGDIIGVDKARPLFNEFLGSFEKLFSPASEGEINLHAFSTVTAELFLENQVDKLFKSNNVISVIVGKGLHATSKNEDGEHKVLEGFNSFLEKHSEIKAEQGLYNAGQYYLTRDTDFEKDAAL